MCPAPQSDLFPDIESSSSEAMPEEHPQARSSEQAALDRPRPTSKPSRKAPKRTPNRPYIQSPWMNVREVAAFFSVSVPTIWRWAKDNPEFPKGHELSRGTTRWYREDLERYSVMLRGETE